MYNNPYFNQQQRYQSNNNQMVQQPYMQQYQPIQPITPINNQIGLLGKVVDSVDVVKSMDIPLDGSTSFFPLADGTAIVSKQLQTDGTSKTTVYKPVTEEQKEIPKYVTLDDVKKEISNIDLSDLDDIKDEIRELKKELKNIKKTKED